MFGLAKISIFTVLFSIAIFNVEKGVAMSLLKERKFVSSANMMGCKNFEMFGRPFA